MRGGVFVFRSLLAAILALVPGCKERSGHMHVASTPELKVREDVAGFAAKLKLPVPVTQVRWCETLRVGPSGAPGPTDTVVYALLVLDGAGWQVLEPSKLNRTGTSRLPGDIARKLLPAGLALPVTGSADASVQGEAYDLKRFTPPRYLAGPALRVDGRLFVILTST